MLPIFHNRHQQKFFLLTYDRIHIRRIHLQRSVEGLANVFLCFCKQTKMLFNNQRKKAVPLEKLVSVLLFYIVFQLYHLIEKEFEDILGNN